MKHFFKKGLSLFLAVLMVVSMLPMDAMAVAFLSGEDEPDRVEEPVLDVGDPIVDTQAGQISQDDREAVETPDTGEGDEPAKPSWTNLPLELEIDQSGNYTIKISANGVTGSGGSGNNAFAIMLDKAAAGGVAPGSLPVGSGHANVSALTGVVAATKLPNALFEVGGDVTFTFAGDGSYNGEVLQGSLGSFQDFLAEAQKIDPSLSGEIPLRVILVTQAGSPSSPAGVSQATFTWKAGKDAVLKAKSLNGGDHVVPGNGYVELVKNDDMKDFIIYADNIVQDATLTVTGITYTGTGQGDQGDGTMYISVSDENYNNPSGVGPDGVTLYMELVKSFVWDPATNPSGLVDGVITIDYSVDGVTGSAKKLEIPVRTKVTGELIGTKITVTVPRGGTATGGSTTVTSAEKNASSDFAAAGIIGKDLYAALLTGKNGQKLTGPAMSSHESDVQTIPGGITWSFVKTIPDLAWDADDYGLMWGSDGSSYDSSVFNFGKTGGAFGSDDLVQATVGSSVALGTHFVGNLVLPYVFTDQTEGVYYPGSAMLVTIPVFVEVIEGEVENNDFTLKYDANGTGVSGLPGDQTYSGPEATHPFALTFSPAPTRTGYVFKGWSDSSGSSNTADYTDGGTTSVSVNANSTKTVYAVWAPTYTVTYQNSSTTGHPSVTAPTDASSPYEGGSTVSILGVAGLSVGDERDGTESPTPKVYKFLGWDMGGTKYYTGDSFTINANATLTAAWEEVTYTVKYNGNGVTITNASSFTDETGLSNGAQTTKASGTPTATGKTFTGWATKADGTGTTVAVGSQYTVAKADANAAHEIILYAQWGDQTRTVSYDLNGKTFAPGVLTAPADETVTYGGDVDPLSTAISTSTNYVDTSGKGWTFVGWGPADTSTAADAITKVTNVTTNTTVYAIWAPTMHTVTYAVGAAGASGAVAAPTTYSVQHGTTHTVKATTDLTAATGVTDWKPNGWDETNSTITVNGDVTITGQWQVLVSFDENETSKTPNVAGVSGMPSAQWVDYGGKATAPTADPTASNWTFSSWKDAATGGNTVDFSTKTFTAPAIIYATWGDKDTTAVFYLNGGDKWQDNATDASITVTGTPGGNASPGAGKTPPVRADYTFDGWATTNTGTTGVTPKFPAAGATAPNEYYAIWTRDQSNIKFVFGNGATDQTETGDTKASLAAAKFPANPTRANYRFNGWKGDDGAVYSSAALPQFPAAKNATLTITAQWVAQSTVVFDLNGGTLAAGKTIPGSQTGDVNTAIGTLPTAVAAGDVTKTGYTFAGWALNKNNGTAADAVTVANIKYPTTVNTTDTYYAIWTINTYTVTYDKGDHGGSDVPSPQTGNYNTTVTLTGTMNNSTESNIHWIFKGWSTTKNDTSTKVTKFDNIAADHKVYALWEKDTHNLTYNANAGGATVTNLPTTVTGVECGTATAVDVTTVPVWNASHRFLGWDTDSTATTPTYPKGVAANITLTSNTTLYAIWESVVTVTWKTGGGTWSTALGGGSADKTQTDKSGSPMTTYTGGTDVTRAGYRFKEWSNNPGTTMPNADTTYTAQWDRLYNVVFDLNAPSGATDITVNPTSVAKVTDKIVGETATLTALSDTQGNYVFKGWDTSSTATTATYTPTGTYTVVASHASGTDGDNAKITLYGVWVKKTNVTYNTGAGAWATAPSGGTTTSWSAKGDPTVSTDTYTVPADPARSGYDFAGWLKTGDAAVDTSKTAGATPRFPTTDETYTAQWKVKQYKVTFVWNTTAHSHTATEKYADTSGDFGAAITTPTTNPSMVGYTFGGWYKEAACTNALAGTDTYPANDDMVVYAKWTPIEYTITYADPQNGAASGMPNPLAQKGNYDDTHTLAAAPTGKTGYVWDGWYDGNTKVTADFTITGDRTLNAKWKITVSFDIHDPATPSTLTDPTDQVIAAGGTVTLPTQADLTDYQFLGWFAADTGGTALTGTETYSTPTTLHAQWKAKEYTYTFDPNGGAFPNGTAGITTTGGIGTAIPGPNDGATTPATVDPVWKDHSFKGWNADQTAASAGTADSSLPDATMPSGGKTIYAAWTENTYKYNFDANKGTWGGTPEVTVQTKTGKAGATVTAPDPAPTYTDGSGRNYRFDGWSTVKDDASKKITTFTITGNANDGDVTDTVYALWTPLYTITYHQGTDFTANIAQPTNPSQTDVPAGTYNAAAPYTNTAAGAYISATGGSWDGTVRFNTADGKHWKFEGWTPDGGTTKINAGGNVTISNADITLTAVWTQEYKVTMKDGVRADETTSAGNAGGKLNGSSSVTWSHASTPYIYVSGPFGVADAVLLNNNSDHVFVKWMATNTGAFTGGTTESTNATDTFTPTGDTELTPVFAKKPGLTPAVDGYQLNFATGAAVPAAKWQPAVTPITKSTNTLPTYTWDKGDATIGDVTIQKAGDTSATTLTEGTHYTYNSTTGVIEFQRAYLLGLEATKSYTVTVKSTTNGVNTDKTATLWAVVTPDDLLRVEIGVKPDTASDYEADPVVNATPVANRTKSASVTDTNRNVVKYLDHAETTIIPSNLLTYQWYYAPGPSTPNRHTAVGNLALPTGAVAIGTSTTDNFVDMDNDTYKGKYIFATVVATGTGKDAVVTNSIPVDYDAVIKVNKDGAADTTDGVYTVYLVPQPTTGSNAATYAAASLPTSKVATTHTASTNQYATATSALTGGVTYDIYVNRLEGDASIFVKTGKTVSTQTAAAAAPVLDFYSVNAVDTNLLHKQDANNEYVGESFGAANADAPVTELYAEGIATKFDSGKGVFTGTKVTAKASKTWTQDYDVNWGMKEDTATTAPTLTYGADNQVAADAKNTGKDYTNIDAKTWIGAQLEQNVYTITGNVWVNGYTAGSRAGIVASGSVPTLEYVNATTGKTYLFKATVNNNGVHQSTVTFTGVPRSSQTGGAIAGKYVVTATAKPSDTKSTIKKYIPGQDVSTATDTSIAGVGALTDQTLAADVVAGGVTGPMFTVVVEGSTYSLKAADQEPAGTQKSAIHTLPGTPTTSAPSTPSGNRLATQPWTGTYAGITTKTYTIDVTNEGNMPLDVTLNIKRTMDGTDVIVYGPDKAGTDDLTASGSVWTDSDNDVTFGDLKETFSLAAKGDAAGKDKVTFTVTIPDSLTVNSAADYAFELTSKEGALYGPSVTYKLTQKVTPLKITDIQVKSAGTNAWQPDALAIDSSTTIPTGVDQSAEVEYKWYVAPTTSSNVALNKTGTGTLTGTGLRSATASGVSGNTYTLAAADQGMSLYLVAHNKDTGNIIEADFVKVADLPYDLEIQVNEDSNPTANKGNYTVYLWPTTGGTFDKDDAKAISATATAADDGRYKATGLVPGTTYDIYTNAVGGTADHYQKSGTQASLTDFTGKNVPIVTYRSVTINNTTTDNSPYSFADSTDPFLKDADGTTTTLDGTLKKPTATLKGAATKVADPDAAASRWVQAGTEITVTYPAWIKDYTLSWDVGSDVTNAAANASGDVTVNTSTTIDSNLKLNLYEIKAHVVGKGDVKEIILTGTGDMPRSFTSIAAHDSLLNGTNGASGNIQQGQSVTFKVPKGTYNMTAEPVVGTTLEGYRKPHKDGDLSDHNDKSPLAVTTTTDPSFDVVVSATGKALTVTDNATTFGNATNGTGTARFQDGAVNNGDPVEQTITLPYGYSDSTLTLTVENTSPDGGPIYQVKMNDPTLDASGKITVTAPAAPNTVLDGTADMALDATTPVAVKIAAGLGVGDYDSELAFAYNAVSGDTSNRPVLTYKLKVTVVPTKFTNVTVVDGDNATVTDVALGKDLKFDSYTTSTVDDWTNGKHLTAAEYTYQWYHGPANKTAGESWDPATGAVTVTDATAISGANTATLAASEIAKYPGEHIYLVISAVKDKNVIEAAISAPITTGFQPVVKVEVDGVDQSTVAGFDGTGYTATIDDGTTTWNTVWDDTAKGFVPVGTDGTTKVSLDATKEYTAKVSRVQGDGTNLVALSDKLKNTTTDDTVTAEYFTVNTVETKAFEGITGLGEDFGGTDKRTGPNLSLALADNTALTTGTPVLKNQSVVAKAADWTQDYELTWYTRMDGAATVPTRDTAYEGTPTMTARGGKVDHTSASGTGYTVNQVTNKLYVGGRLDQITYTVVGTVAGTGTVGQVALEQTAPKGANYIYPDTTTPPTSPVKPTSTASVTDGPLAKDETVTFTVVKGTFTITPTEGANTVIKKVSWEGTDEAAGVTTLTGKTIQLKAADPKRTYNFVVTVEGADIKLKVSDDQTTAVAAESTPNAWKDAANGVERYFNYLHFKKTDSTDGDIYEYALKLTNAGNKDVKVNAEVYHFATAPATGFGVDAATWTATKATGTKVYETADGATKALTGASGKTVLSLADMLSANTVVAAKSATTGADGAADAGKITLSEDAWAKDSGAYVFHFMGETNDADKTPVDVYYVLDLTIDQLPIVGVATNNDGSTMPGVGDALTVKGYSATAASDKSLENVTVQTSTQTSQTADAATAKLTGDDVHFAWVKVSGTTTLTKNDIVGNTTVNTSGELTTTKTGWTITQGRSYTLVDGDQDHNFYLVAFAPNYTGNVTNATDLAVADVIKTKRTAGVKVNLNGFQVTGTTDPGYEIYLVENGKTFNKANAATGTDGTWATAWNSTNNRYEAAIDVENKTYQVYAVTYKGGDTVIQAITGTLGAQTPTGTKTVETVPYWDVTFTENVAVDNTHDGFKSYLPGKGTTGAAATDNAIQKALSVKVSTTKGGTTYEANALTASTTSTDTTIPVLEGMNVQVTVDATKSSKNAAADVKKSWSETDVQPLHTLTATGSGWTNSADNKSSGIQYAASIVSNPVTVDTSAKSFSAKLEQVLFDVEFTVEDISENESGTPTPSSKTKVRQVTLTPDTGRGETGSYSAVSSVGSYGHGDTVAISGVPVGSFVVKAAEQPGTPTLVKGYTWNNVPDPISTDGKIVTVVGGTNADDTNKHTGNLIKIIEATKVVNWSHTFDDKTGGILADGAFEPSNGFVKADDTSATPKKLFGLTEGYAESKGDVLKYTVRVANGGTDDMTGFYLTRSDNAATSPLTYDLTHVTWHKADGTEVPNHNAMEKFTLGPGDYLEFSMDIPEGKAAQRDNYKTEITPHCDLNAGENLGGGTYAPEYQVKSPIKFKPGHALVKYGGSDFESGTEDIKLDWPATTDEQEPTFDYELLVLDGTNDAAILKEINDALSLSLTTLDAQPTWLTYATSTGAVTMPTGAHVDTNVKVKGTPADFAAYDLDANGHKVNNEVTLYFRATDTKTKLTYVIPYVVNVEPGELKIDATADFAPTDPVGGQKVDKSEFTYLKVSNQATAPLDVVPALDAGAKRTGAGNDPVAANAGNGKVFVDNVHTATWSVAPTEYVSDVATEYVFTVTYKPADAVEKWNYRPDTYKKTLTANRPPLGLTFGDVLGVSSIEPAGAELKLGRAPDAGYSDIKTDNLPYAPAAMDDTPETFRKGEFLTYLDTEPKYTVTITATGDLHDVKVEQALAGFKVVKGDLSFTTMADGEKKTFELELAPVSGNKWVGTHTAKFTVTGKGASGDSTSATYELEVTMAPKVIAQAHVTDLTDPTPIGDNNKPDTTVTVAAEDPEGKDIKPTTPDKHDNTPMEPKVTWTDPQGNPVDPTKPFEDGKDYKVTVDLPADPNYTFKDQKQPEEIPNYTLNGKTDVNDDPALEDEKLTVWVTTENDPPVPDRNKKVTFEKTTDLPKFAHLEFEDVNADDEEDSMPHAVNVNRPTITVQRGDALGKYIISLGAYDNAVSPVEITQVNGLPDGAVWNLTPNTLDRLDDVTATPAGDKQSYTLDLSGVYTVDLDAKLYTLELTATGKDANYPDRDVTPATYKINIQVTPADPSKLMFKDLRTKGTDAETTNVITPAENVYAETYTRVITVKWDKANGGWYPLGTYNIDLGAFTNNVRDLALNSTGTITSDSVAKDLSAAIRDFNANQAKLDKDGVWSFALDLSDVDYATLNTDATEEKDLEYLELTATGKDLNGTTVKATYKLALKFEVPPKPVLKFDDVKQGGGTSDPATTGPEVNDTREITAVEGTKLGKYTIYLGAYDAAVKVNSITSTRSPNMVYDVTPDCATVTPVTLVERKGVGDAQAFELDLTEMVTKPGTYTLTLVAQGVDLSGKYTVNASYTLTITIRTKSTGGGGGGGGTSCPNQVTYLLGLYGTTKDSTMEMVSGKAVKSVPNVSALEGYKFLGWSLAGPTGNAEQDAKRTLVDPKSVTINGDTTFYAVYQVLYKVPQPPVHKHYVIGYPNGNFGPADNIDRASVATIIARAVLPNFVEGADYGNPGGYSDVDGHWAESAIAYCSKYGVFKGYDDGTFRPKQPISRQELALVMARLSGVKSGSAPFSDITTAGDWAKDGIYTAYANGWVNGYTDGTFKPLNPIRRDETVKIFNAYLGRGVDAEGLSALTEYVHTGVASNVTENGTTEYMTWPDVTKDQWAYYEIIEAANDHEFAVDATQPKGYAVPETWTKCWIDEKWRYHDDANDGGPSAVVSALTRKFGAAD